ncbi:MAG: hypothetical protein R3Y61_06245 [Rikenellaceae bacterium]
MKKILTLIFAFACILTASAQETTTSKEVLIVDNFTLPSSSNSTFRSIVEDIRNKVIAAIVKSQRVEVIDASTDAFISKMQEDATSELALESVFNGAELRETAYKKFGAKYGLTGHVAKMRGIRERTEDGSVYYTGEMSISLKVINLVDGTIVHSRDYAYAGITGAIGNTETAAVTNTAEYLVAAMPKFIDNSFKVNGRILAIQTEKKGVAKTVLLDLGSAAGVKAKDKLKVYKVEIIQGRENRSEIGTIQVTEVGGVDISTAKVSAKSCGTIIYEYINNPGSYELVLESTTKSGFGATLSAIGRTLVQ